MAYDPFDDLDDLTTGNETKLFEGFDELLESYLDGLNLDALETALDDDDANHVRQQVRTILGLPDDTETDEEADSNTPTAIAGGLGVLFVIVASFVGAVAARASAMAGHVLNPADSAIREAADNAPDFLRSFTRDTGLAISAAIENAIYSPASAADRAQHLRRSIGLSIKQAVQIETMHKAMREYLNSPKRLIPAHTDASGKRIPAQYVRKADATRILARTRGHISGPQRQLLEKALRNPKLSEADATRLLDRHARALRRYRTKVAFGEGMHALVESSKLLGWKAAQAVGALPADQRRYWRTAQDERVRHSHAQVPSMNPNGQPLDQPFATPFGAVMFPPLEINCRCRVHLKPSK